MADAVTSKVSAGAPKDDGPSETPQQSETNVPAAQTQRSGISQHVSSGAATPQKKNNTVSTASVNATESANIGDRTVSQEATTSKEKKTTSQRSSATSRGGRAAPVDSRSHPSDSVLPSHEASGGSEAEETTVEAASSPDGSSQHRLDEMNELLQDLETDLADPREGFKVLDDLFTSGKINEAQYKDLQRKHKYLQSMFWSCLQNRSTLREEIIETSAYLEELKEHARQQQLSAPARHSCDDTADFHSVSDLEGKNVDELKKYLAVFDQQRRSLENSAYQMRFKTRHLQEEKEQLSEKVNELNASHSKLFTNSPVVIEKEVRELSTEIRCRKQEIRNVKEEIETRERLIPQREAKIAKLEEKIKSIIEEKEELTPKQLLISRDADRESKVASKLRKQFDTLNGEVVELVDQLKESNDTISNLDAIRNEMIKDMHKDHKISDAKSKECISLARDIDRCRERCTLLMDEKNRSQARLNAVTGDIRSQQNTIRDITKAVERVDRDLRSAEESLQLQSDQANASKGELEKLSKTVQHASREVGDLPARRRSLQREVDVAHAEVNHLFTMTVAEKQSLAWLTKERAAQVRLQETLNKELDALMREHNNAIRQRDTNARLYKQRADEVKHTEDNLRNHFNECGKFRKKCDDAEKNSKLLGQRYEVAKKERDEMSTQLMSQLSSCEELRRKIEILRSQQDTMLSRKLELERQYALTRAATIKTILDKTMIQCTMNQERDQQRELEKQRDQLEMMISCNQMALNQLKEWILTDLETYKKQVVDRNERGLLLVEREEEVCAFQEKISLQQLFIDRGYAQLDTLENDITELNKIVGTEKHHIKCLSARQLEIDSMEAWLTETRCEMRGLNKQILFNVHHMETPVLRHCRLLLGRPEDPVTVAEHLNRMQLQLYETELRLLERQMVAAQAERLVGRAQADIQANRAHAERLAERANVQSRIATASNKKLMASAAEVSVTKAEARRLCEQRAALRRQLELARGRVAAGMPPLPGERPARSEAAPLPPTPPPAAPSPRPTQYMPQAEGVLPVPRAYGAFGPFKPQVPGARLMKMEKRSRGQQ